MPVAPHHILHGRPVIPAARLLQRLYPPHARCPVEAKELVEVPLHLLLHLKVVRKVDALEPGQQILARVHKRPPGLGREAEQGHFRHTQ